MQDQAEGLQLFKETLHKAAVYRYDSDVQAREALKLTKILNKSLKARKWEGAKDVKDRLDPTILAGIRFHRNLAKSLDDESTKYLMAASATSYKYLNLLLFKQNYVV